MNKLLKKFTNARLLDDHTFFVVVLILVALAATLLSLLIGLRQSIWFDEAYSIMVAQRPIGEIFHLTSLDTHPPVYYLVLKLWGWLFGWSEIALRSLSALSLGGAVAVGGLVARRMFGPRAAVAGLMFLVLAPFLLRYGFEIRMYALASLIGMAATYFLVVAHQARDNAAKRKNYIIYGIFVALGVLTLYYSVLLWLGHLLWLIWMTLKRREPLRKAPWIVGYLVSIVLFLPWLPAFIGQMGNGALAPISQAMSIENILGVITFNFLYTPLWQLNPYQSALALFVITTLIVVLVRAYRHTVHRDYFLLMLAYILVPIVALVGLSLGRPSYVERYLSHVAIGLVLLTGIAVWLAEQHRPSRMLRAAAALLIVVEFVGFINLLTVGNYNFQRLEKPDVKYIAGLVQDDCKKGADILAADPYTAIEVQYYLPNCVVHFYSQSTDLKGGYAPLANSQFRVDSPVPRLAGATLYYIYYGEPDLQLDQSYQSVDRAKLGALSVEKLTAAQRD